MGQPCITVACPERCFEEANQTEKVLERPEVNPEDDRHSDLSAGVDSNSCHRKTGTLSESIPEARATRCSLQPTSDARVMAGRASIVPVGGLAEEELAIFAEALTEKGVDFSSWPRSARGSVDHLFWESEVQQRCVILKKPANGAAKRAVRLVKVRLLADIFGVEHVLTSRLQIGLDGVTMKRSQLPLRRLAWNNLPEAELQEGDENLYKESCPYTEDWVGACKTALQDRLGLSMEWQSQHLEEDVHAHVFRLEDGIESNTYVGLKCVYAIHEVVYRVTDSMSAGVQCIGLPNGQEFATTEGNFEVSYDGGDTSRNIGTQLNVWTWERFQVDPSKRGPRSAIKRVPIPELSGETLRFFRMKASRPSVDHKPPSASLWIAQDGRVTDWERVRRMAARISDRSYSLTDFFEDLSAFPELDLYLLDGNVVPGHLKGTNAAASSGRTIGDEYQRTVGAFFSIYWLFRLDVDGKEGFSFGVDDSNKPIMPDAGEDRLYPAEKRLKFYNESQWDQMQSLLVDADMLKQGKDGTFEVNQERVQTLLALTAVHDIMKIETLLPRLQESHAPYHGYAAGDTIGDHDRALSYIMEYYPDLLPSFSGLQEEEQKAVQFTQCQLCFNHGWFVQAEAPPGAIFTTFRNLLQQDHSQQVTAKEIALYFVHWLTDLAGAEPTPLGGCEKFVTKFPLAVLNSFLRSFKFVQQIATKSETYVMEEYLKMRWAEYSDTPCRGPDAVPKMRLLCMAQTNAERILRGFEELDKEAKHVLCVEMSRTGCQHQHYSSDIVTASVRDIAAGPALLIYYGPAFLQGLGSDCPVMRLWVLAEVYRCARHLWPCDTKQAGSSVTVRIDAIKSLSIIEIQQVAETDEAWALIRKNDIEAFVERCTNAKVNEWGKQCCILNVSRANPELG